MCRLEKPFYRRVSTSILQKYVWIVDTRKLGVDCARFWLSLESGAYIEARNVKYDGQVLCLALSFMDLPIVEKLVIDVLITCRMREEMRRAMSHHPSWKRMRRPVCCVHGVTPSTTMGDALRLTINQNPKATRHM